MYTIFKILSILVNVGFLRYVKEENLLRKLNPSQRINLHNFETIIFSDFFRWVVILVQMGLSGQN